tara:strand:+ start:210 stop:677 length:468 start_codon:yes stop_codon:yes gene_type:complete
MNLSVGDFAEQIMAQDKAEKRATSISEPSFQPDTSVYSPIATDQVDISNVEVPNDFVQSIVENREVVLEETPTSPTPVVESNDFANMMLEIRDLLVEVKQTLSEINTVGAFAPNLATKKKKAKKKVKKTPKKQEYEEEEDIVELLMKKLRSKVVD